MDGGRISLPADYAQSHSDASRLATDIVEVLRSYIWIADSYAPNYFTRNLWNAFPESWSSFVGKLSSLDLIRLPSTLPVTEEWPEDLALLIRQSRRLVLPRDPTHWKDVSEEEQERTIKSDIDRWRSPQPDAQDAAAAAAECAAEVDQFLTLFMSIKKRHEVLRMGSAVKSVATQQNVPTFLDIGSGEGYLSRVLAWYHSLNIVAVDGSASFTEGAEKRSQQVSKALDQRESESTLTRKGRLFHVEAMIDPKMNASQLNQFLEPFVAESSPSHLAPCLIERLGITGLHCCGDLTPTMMRLFVSSESTKALCCVGCCYNRLEQRESNGELLNFPMSNHMTSLNIRLSWDALRVACESVAQWTAQTVEEYDSMVLDTWRRFKFDALFKLYNREHFNCNCAISLRRFNSKASSFGQYVANALKKIRIGDNPESASTCSIRGDLNKHLEYIKSLSNEKLYEIELLSHLEQRQLGAFFALRVAVGSLLETAILLDRYLFLAEHPSVESVSLVPIFDERLSPRNMLLTATKKKGRQDSGTE